MRQYEIRTYTGQVHSSLEAVDKAAALALVAADQSLLPLEEASRLVRLANPADGAERHVWSYPAAWDWSFIRQHAGLLAESEDY